MSRKQRANILPNFDARSAVLFAALAIGGIATGHAQQTYPPGSRDAAPQPESTSPRAGIGPAAGSPKPGPTAQDIQTLFSRLDTNNDGKLSVQEAQGMTGLAAKFAAIDTNSDKFISKAEFEAAMTPP